jgi:hypothetical protein
MIESEKPAGIIYEVGLRIDVEKAKFRMISGVVSIAEEQDCREILRTRKEANTRGRKETMASVSMNWGLNDF